LLWDCLPGLACSSPLSTFPRSDLLAPPKPNSAATSFPSYPTPAPDPAGSLPQAGDPKVPRYHCGKGSNGKAAPALLSLSKESCSDPASSSRRQGPAQLSTSRPCTVVLRLFLGLPREVAEKCLELSGPWFFSVITPYKS
jgi:hypothetical protein